MNKWLLMPIFVGCIDKEDTCDQPPSASNTAVCLVNSEIPMENQPLDLSLTGTVVSMGQGEPPNGCVDWHSTLGNYTSDDVTEVQWLQFEPEDGIRSTLAMLLPADISFLDGQNITVSYQMDAFEPFGGEWGNFSVYIENDSDESLLWFRDFGLGDFGGGLQLAYGETELTCTDECSTLEYSKLIFSLNGEENEISYGQQGELGDYTAFHLGAVKTSDQECSESHGSWSKIAVVKSQ